MKLKGPCKRWDGTHRKQDGRPYLGKVLVYRLEYKRVRGPIPKGKGLHHLCEHKWCINPWHVEPLTQSQHVKIHEWGGDKNVGNALKTKCPAGHRYTKANTALVCRGGVVTERYCKTCRRAAEKRYKERRRAIQIQ